MSLEGDKNKSVKKGLWLLSTSRNALVVIICSIFAFFAETMWGGSPFLLTGKVRYVKIYIIMFLNQYLCVKCFKIGSS